MQRRIFVLCAYVAVKLLRFFNLLKFNGWDRNYMTKTELISIIAEKVDTTKTAAGNMVDTLIEVISQALAKGESIVLPGFGTFYVGHRGERSGRNPQTGATITIKAAKVPRFRAGKQLKEDVNK
jgi:DNA-binding protein HU-beta